MRGTARTRMATVHEISYRQHTTPHRTRRLAPDVRTQRLERQGRLRAVDPRPFAAPHVYVPRNGPAIGDLMHMFQFDRHRDRDDDGDDDDDDDDRD